MKNKLNKELIISGIQFFLIAYLITMGFIFTYLTIWWTIDSLPKESCAVIICAVAGLISTGCLFTWITMGNKREISKKEMCENAKSICNGDCETCAWHE